MESGRVLPRTYSRPGPLQDPSRCTFSQIIKARTDVEVLFPVAGTLLIGRWQKREESCTVGAGSWAKVWYEALGFWDLKGLLWFRVHTPYFSLSLASTYTDYSAGFSAFRDTESQIQRELLGCQVQYTIQYSDLIYNILAYPSPAMGSSLPLSFFGKHGSYKVLSSFYTVSGRGDNLSQSREERNSSVHSKRIWNQKTRV